MLGRNSEFCMLFRVVRAETSGSMLHSQGVFWRACLRAPTENVEHVYHAGVHGVLIRVVVPAPHVECRGLSQLEQACPCGWSSCKYRAVCTAVACLGAVFRDGPQRLRRQLAPQSAVVLEQG